MNYTMAVESTPDGYAGFFPDLPSCSVKGSTLEELKSNAIIVLTQLYESRGIPPTPREAGRPHTGPIRAHDFSQVIAFLAIPYGDSPSHEEPKVEFPELDELGAA